LDWSLDKVSNIAGYNLVHRNGVDVDVDVEDYRSGRLRWHLEGFPVRSSDVKSLVSCGLGAFPAGVGFFTWQHALDDDSSAASAIRNLVCYKGNIASQKRIFKLNPYEENTISIYVYMIYNSSATTTADRRRTRRNIYFSFLAKERANAIA
jgi:hypothetical protein